MSDSSGISRRRYLSGMPVTLTLAGCIGLSSEDNNGGLTRPPALVNLALQYVGIGTAVVDFEVQKDGEMVHTETYEMEGVDPGEVEGGSGVVGSDTGEIVRFEGKPWMNERVRYAVTADLHGGGTATYTTDDYLAEYGDRDCPEFILVVGVLNGEVRPMGGPAPPNCDNPIPLP